MKDLAKDRLNKQVGAVQDAETEIKVLTLNSVLNKEDYGTTNKKVLAVINKAVNKIESADIKNNVKTTLTNYASRIYLEWLKIFGTAALGMVVLGVLSEKEIKPTESVKTALKSLPQEIPDYVYNRAVPLYEEPKLYEKQINTVLDAQAKEDYSERYSLRASIERQVRSDWQDKQLQALKESGIKFVWIDTHANCSERCQAWQGRLYSLDGTSGKIDGIPYQPLENATERYETTKAGKTYRNGTLTGFNCRHKAIPYKKGFKPQTIPAEVINRQREIEKKQRELERNCRKYETRALGYRELKNNKALKSQKFINTKLYKHNRALMEKWKDEYIRFCEKNNVPIYYSRLKV